MVKNPTTNEGDSGDICLIPESGRSPEDEMAPHSSILAWKIPWAKEPGRLQSRGCKESDMTEHTHTHIHTHIHTQNQEPDYVSKEFCCHYLLLYYTYGVCRIVLSPLILLLSKLMFPSGTSLSSGMQKSLGLHFVQPEASVNFLTGLLLKKHLD